MSGRSVFVKATSAGVTADNLLELCSEAGEIEGVLWREEGSGVFVTFGRTEDARRALGLSQTGMVSVAALDAKLEAERVALKQGEEASKLFRDSFQLLTPAKRQQAIAMLSDLGHQPKAQQSKASPSAAASSLGFPSQPELHEAATSSPVAAPQVMTVPQAWPEATRLCSFSGTTGKDSPFSKWHYEVACLVREQHPEATVLLAIRKSLKSPAADVLRRLGETATLEMVLSKFQCLYGKVLDGDEILKRFYGEKQGVNESCVDWSCRLEEYLFEALEQGAATPSLRSKLARRFWDGLTNGHVRNALRHQDLPFDELVIEARKVEEEGIAVSTPPARAHAQPVAPTKESTNDKLDLLLERLNTLEAKVSGQSSQSRSSGSSSETRKCYKCQQPGHLAFGCRANTDVTCYKCDSRGHIAPACLKGRALQK
jgi:hypothetical protein